jgi:hypothetical protein
VESLSSKKKKEQVLKSKRGETLFERLHVSKGEKKRRVDLHAAGRDSMEIKKEMISHFPIVQNSMCGLIHSHTSFAFALPSNP